MTVAATTGATAATTQTNSQKATEGLAKDFTQFMTLLTTQLKNQDPTAPMDSTAFTQQLVSFTGVQQSVEQNSNLEKLISLMQGGQQNTYINAIGKNIEAKGNATSLTKDGAKITYDLASTAANVAVTISDSGGNVVFRGTGTSTAGRNTVNWDGTNITTGETMPDGNYTFTVSAADAKGTTIAATTYTTGVVQSVDVASGITTFSVAGANITPDQVLRYTNSI